MRYITLVIVPGPGQKSVEVNDNMTLAELAAAHSLNGRNLIIDGRGVPADQWSATTLEGVVEVFATGSVKGN
jgi:sulfur carrier protein ThiS